MRKLFMAIGTTASSVLTVLQSNRNLKSGEEKQDLHTLVFDSDTSDTHHHLPKLVLPGKNKMDMYRVAIPEEDLKRHLPARPHLNYISYDLLKRSDSQSGLGLRRDLGSVAAALHRDMMKLTLKGAIGHELDARKSKKGSLTIFRCCASPGGTGSSLYFPQAEIIQEIRDEVGDGISKTWVFDFIIVPNFNTESQLSPEHLANTAAFLSEMGALQENCLRYRKITVEAQSDEVYEPLRPTAFILSDINDDILKTKDLIATTARIIEWLGTTPLGDAFKTRYVDIEANLKRRGSPLINRIGASSVFFPQAEAKQYMLSRSKVKLIEAVLETGGNLKAKANEILSNERLLEDNANAFISKQLSTINSQSAYDIIRNKMDRFQKGSKKAAACLPQLKNYLDWLESEEILGKTFKAIDHNAQALAKDCELRAAIIFENLIKSDGLGKALLVGGELVAASKESVQKIAFRMEQDAKRQAQKQESAQKLYEQMDKIVNHPLKRIFYAYHLNQAIREYRRQRAEAVELMISQQLKAGALEVLKAFLKGLTAGIKQLKGMKKELVSLLEKERAMAADLVDNDYAYRGLGQCLTDGGCFKKDFDPAQTGSDLDQSSAHELAKLLGEHFSGKANIQLDAVVQELALRTMSGLVSDLNRMQAIQMLLDHPERKTIIRQAFRQARELTPVDEVIGAGIHLTLVGFRGTNNSLLCDEIEAAARNEKVEGEIKFVEMDDPTQIIFIRTEIGRQLRSLKILGPCYGEYEKKGKDKYQHHTNPLWGLLPALVNQNGPDHAFRFFVYGLLAGSIRENGSGHFTQHLLDGETVEIDPASDSQAMESWASHYGYKVDTASRYIHLIKKTSFKATYALLEEVRAKYKTEPWAHVIEPMIQELKIIAKTYHQTL